MIRYLFFHFLRESSLQNRYQSTSLALKMSKMEMEMEGGCGLDTPRTPWISRAIAYELLFCLLSGATSIVFRSTTTRPPRLF